MLELFTFIKEKEHFQNSRQPVCIEYLTEN